MTEMRNASNVPTEAIQLRDLPEGRYFDGTYQWDKEDGEWIPLRAPSGMPSQPDIKSLRKVVTQYEPLPPGPVSAEEKNVRDEVEYRLRTIAAHYRSCGKHGIDPGDLLEREIESATQRLMALLSPIHTLDAIEQIDTDTEWGVRDGIGQIHKVYDKMDAYFLAQRKMWDVVHREVSSWTTPDLDENPQKEESDNE